MRAQRIYWSLEFHSVIRALLLMLLVHFCLLRGEHVVHACGYAGGLAQMAHELACRTLPVDRLHDIVIALVLA